MGRRYAQWVLPAAALVGLVVSAWLLVMYQSPAGAMACGPGGGCHTVRMCKLANVGGVSWPIIGVASFAVLLAASLSRQPTVRRSLPWLGAGAAVTGLTLIVLQKVVCHALCPYCLVADGAGIVAGLAAWWGRPGRTRTDEPGPPYRAGGEVPDGPDVPWLVPRVQWAFGGVAVACLAGLLVKHQLGGQPAPIVPHRVATLPEPIAREQRPGQATIVEFADFECPYCRRQHEAMGEVMASYGRRVRFVRKHVPLSFHRHAMDAARATCCAEEQGRSEPMADALVRTEPDEMTREGCEAIAARLELDIAAYRVCIDAQRTTDRIEHDRLDATASGVEGLPTTFVGSERFDGVVPAATLRASIDRALANPPTPAPPHS